MRNTPVKFREEEERLSEGYLSSDTVYFEDYLEKHGSEAFKQYIREYRARRDKLWTEGIAI
jgi:hypothetical protein